MNELDQLRKENEDLKDQIRKLRSRGAGRKTMFNAYQISNMKNARNKGLTYKQIAEKYNCSTSLIHKLINEK